MFQEVERTYRTALEEELQWNINFLKILIIILLVSSCALLIYLIMHSIILRYPGSYSVIISEFTIREFFMNFFAIIAIYVTYPVVIILAILIIKMIRYFSREEKGKLLLSVILLLSQIGLSMVIGLVRIIYVVSAGFPTFLDGYYRMNLANGIIFFFIDYLTIAIAMLLLSTVFANQKESGGYTGNMMISPIILLSMQVLWMFLVILYYSLNANITWVKLVNTTAVVACLTSAVMIGMFAEILVNLKKIQVPQIIALKEKSA